jgi:hypothetical protein
LPCVKHLHIHCVLEPYDVVTLFRKAMEPRDLDSLSPETVNGLQPHYLLAGSVVDGRVRSVVKEAVESCPTQYFRQLLAAMTETRVWQWQSGMNPSWMLRAYEEFSAGRENGGGDVLSPQDAQRGSC